MPQPSSSDHLPRPPPAYYLLNQFGLEPRSDPIPEVPPKDELQMMILSLAPLANSANKRAKAAAEAVKIGRESLNKSAFAYKLSDVGEAGKVKRGKFKERERLAEDSDDKGTVLKKGTGGSARGGLALGPESKRKEDTWVNGSPRVKRETSASPAPATAFEYARPSSRLGTPVDGQTLPTEKASIKFKKRKLAHLTSPEADHASVTSLRGRGDSTVREASVPVAQSHSATPGGSSIPPGERPSLLNQQTTSGLKVKLSLSSTAKNRGSLPPAELGTSPLQTAGVSPLGNTDDSAIQQIINFVIPTPKSQSVSGCQSLVPVRPPIPHPPKPLPKRQKDVNQDFSTVKHVTQNVQWSTFWNGIEPYLKDFGEEELAMLGFRPEDIEPFVIPPLGKHYQDIWDEEDSALPFASASSAGPPAVNAWDMLNGDTRDFKPVISEALLADKTYVPVTEMVDDDLWDEAKGLGGLNERAVAALLKPVPPGEKRHVPAKNGPGSPSLGTTIDLLEGKNALVPTTPKNQVPQVQLNGDAVSPYSTDARMIKLQHTPTRGRDPAAVSKIEDGDDDSQPHGPLWPIRPHRIPSPSKRANEREKASTLDAELGQLEEGVARELRLLGLMEAEETIDWSLREDDEICCALRSSQRLLRTQIAVNNARKDRLLQVTKERLAYGEYKKVLEGLEKLIEQAWTKRYAAIKKAGKRQKGKEKVNANSSTTTDAGAGPVAVTPSKREGVPPLSDQVKLAMSARRRWLDTVGHALEDDPVVGRYRGLPQRSIYEGIDKNGREYKPLRGESEDEEHAARQDA
ncbi:hypothetical protein QFC21_003692 [Naganishia friedmannii]|uniref:Uncharacterized protein n=1 Tax=Naganishia friedmannii TaxID=89922 RepID=A0ACC2VP10_9TREE|nr:hypothetical protein QFC21_003692 [Naganishia friedmannii]